MYLITLTYLESCLLNESVIKIKQNFKIWFIPKLYMGEKHFIHLFLYINYYYFLTFESSSLTIITIIININEAKPWPEYGKIRKCYFSIEYLYSISCSVRKIKLIKVFIKSEIFRYVFTRKRNFRKIEIINLIYKYDFYYHHE